MSVAFRDAMHTTRLKKPLSTLSGKVSKPTIASQCRHASHIFTTVSPMISFRNCGPTQPNIPTAMLQPRRAESAFTAASSTTSTSTPTTISPIEESSAVTRTTAPSNSPPTSAQTLTWNRFLELRASRGRYNTIVSACTAVGSGFAGVVFLAQQDLEKVGNMFFGMDPIFALGAATFASAAVGWLLGPFAGNAVFGLWYRRLRVDMALVGVAESSPMS